MLSSSEVHMRNGDPRATLGYALVHIDAVTLAQLDSRDHPARFMAADTEITAPAIRVGAGDVLSITIFETGSGGLFIPSDAGSRPGNYVQLPPQQVGQDGLISVPWAGDIQAAGETPLQIQQTIRSRLAQRALEPEVIVSFVEHHASQVSVLGEVGAATRFSMDTSGETILSALARAGGPRYPAYESRVTLQRNGRAQTVLLSDIAENPAQNLKLISGDTIYVSHEPRYFLGVGAIGQSTTLSQLDRRFPFGDEDITLADALAKAGGLEDDRANARAVFLYRYESRKTLLRLGLNVPQQLHEPVPTIYVLDMSSAASFFYANQFWMRANDVLFVANSPETQIAKFLSLLLPFAESASASRSAFQ